MYLPDKSKKINGSYPTAIYSNHVLELDVGSLGFLYQHLTPKMRFTFPMRQDIAEKDFLTKEFGAQGFLGWILRLIDKSNLLPKALHYTGGVPVKRPFRDDARELIRLGELDKIVETQWAQLAENANSGRNLFMFPEGKFGYSGNLDSIRKGIWILANKVKNIQLLPATLTYDFLSFPKPILHVSVGQRYAPPLQWEEKRFLTHIKEELCSRYVINPANLFSYILLNHLKDKSWSIDDITSKLVFIATELKKDEILSVSSEFFSSKFSKRINILVENGIRSGYLTGSNHSFHGTEKLFNRDFPKPSLCRKINPYLFHANQLNSFKEILGKYLNQEA